MKPIVKTIAALTNDPNGIAEDQTTASGVALDLNGDLVTAGVASAAAAQIVAIEGAGDNSGITWSVTGKDADGFTITESGLAGVSNGTTKTTRYFSAVTEILPSGAVTGNVEVGFLAADGAVSPTVRVNRNQTSSFKVGLFVEVSSGASLVYTVEHSPDWPESGDFTSGYSDSASWDDTDGLTALTATTGGNIVIPLECVRLKLASQVSGTAKLTVQQAY